ncbi:MAG TPA: hypothetical protein PKE45_03815, partial [Caldilineaceae bacterium]|nr:hypothetical protein [Caldilineaceae bacterium]
MPIRLAAKTMAVLAILTLIGTQTVWAEGGRIFLPLVSGFQPGNEQQVEAAGAQSCDVRVNNTTNKLQECVTVAGVREHQLALQAIADANNGTRAAGTPGYDQSVAYVVGRLQAAGYQVTMQEFPFFAWRPEGPSTLAQITPLPAVYGEDVDFTLLSQTEGGVVTAAVRAVDLQLGPGNTSSSGCEAADFAGFPPGQIALLQRGACTFQSKA